MRRGGLTGASRRPTRFLQRGIAQSGSAPALGAGGRRFKSCCPDQPSRSEGGRTRVRAKWRHASTDRPKTAMSSGQANAQRWVLEFEPERPKAIEPLMGYTSSDDMRSQVRLEFDTKEEAIAYAERNGIPYQVSEPKDRRAAGDLLFRQFPPRQKPALDALTAENRNGPVAQGIEQQPSKLLVAGSNPAGVASLPGHARRVPRCCRRIDRRKRGQEHEPGAIRIIGCFAGGEHCGSARAAAPRRTARPREPSPRKRRPKRRPKTTWAGTPSKASRRTHHLYGGQPSGRDCVW